MQDTIYQKLLELTSKTDSLANSVTTLSDKSSSALSGPIIAALITSILGTLLAQGIDRVLKNYREKERDIREAHSKCLNIKIRLRDLFRQLAMHKFHAQYWWHIHYKEGDPQFKNKYYLEHLRSQSDARAVEKEIGLVKADFLGEVVKFERLKGKKFNVDIEKAQIENIAFEKANTYESNIDTKELRENFAERDEQELREKYFNKLAVFQNIIDKMQ